MIGAEIESAFRLRPTLQSLGFLPDWWEGESLFGWCSRFHALRGGNARVLGRLLFGREHACRLVDIPSGMGRFVEATGGLMGSVETVLRERTVLAAFWPFASDHTRGMLLDAANDVIGTPTVVVLGLRASRLNAEYSLRYCSACHQEGIAARGYATWQLAQQLPGVWWCPQHLQTLAQVSKRRAIWRKPGYDGNVLGDPIDEHEAKALTLMERLASAITKLDRVDERSLASVAIHRLRQLGIATSVARLNNNKLDNWLEASPIVGWMRRQGDLINMPGSRWAGHLLRGRSRSHPLKWQLLWTCAWQSETVEAAVQAFLDAAGGKVFTGDVQQMPLWLEKSNQAVGPGIPAEVEEAFYACQSMQAVARRLGVNIGAIKQWLADYPEFSEAWLRHLRQERLHLAVSRVHEAMKLNPAMSRSEMLKLCSTDVIWLNRNSPASLRSLLNQLPNKCGPQIELF